MAKAGMRRPDPSEPHGTESNKKQHFDRNQFHPVPEIQGKAKVTHKKANPINYDGKW
ncbi:hypothetical protein SDC9_70194 [bioreactor metagenome]|uniref:Uncharacterized protein n=1 Tax=bioreactor metagenome TaxID=1076179 RepID=A0A644Y5K3_9ZZZZ